VRAGTKLIVTVNGPQTWQLTEETTVKRIRIDRPRIRREQPWPEDLLPDPRDPDVVRAKALARSQLTGSSRSNRTQ